MEHALFLLGVGSAFVAVLIGGARAHLLDRRLPKERLPLLEVGMRYQTIHSMGILWCWVASGQFDNRLPLLAGWVFVAGILVFSGSMYTYALSGRKIFLKVPPFGGPILLVGWACLGLSAVV